MTDYAMKGTSRLNGILGVNRPDPKWLWRACLVLCAMVSALLPALSPVLAQTDTAAPANPPDPIEITAPDLEGETDIAAQSKRVDALIEQRLRTLYAQITGLEGVTVTAQSGIVTLGGEVANDEQAQEALALAERVDGTVLVRDEITRLRDLKSNLSPAVEQFSEDFDAIIAALPLIAFALGLFFIIALLGHFLARWTRLWRRILPNIFLAELVAQAVRILAIIIGLVIALNLMGATALMGTILGGAGVIGIAIGFAVRDTLENYVSSIMLSLRQPFRADDHVVIDNHEGIVMRLTSRATILMTLEGNHLRIPNADVFKGIILNYTRNPQRRFDFVLGIDAEDDPAGGMKTGLAGMKTQPFLLADPQPFATIEEVGDSNIVLRFFGWVDQSETDFLKARSMAIRSAKTALESNGFTLPEPIYRLRFDPAALASLNGASTSGGKADGNDEGSPKKEVQSLTPEQEANMEIDVSSDIQVTQTIAKERAYSGEEDLLDRSQPIE